jgi:hypothetical protein
MLACVTMRKSIPLPHRLLLIFLLITALGGPAAAEENDWLFKYSIRTWGGDFAAGYTGWPLFEGVDTILWASAGGGYQQAAFYPADHDSPAPAGETGYVNLNIDWRFGISQGILFHPEQERNLLDFTCLYVSRLQRYLENDSIPSGYPDRDGIWLNTLVSGLVFDTVTFDRRLILRRGFYATLSTELAPGWLGNNVAGDSRYGRFTALAVGHQPLLARPDVSIYLAERLVYDILWGNEEQIPISVRTRIGGLTNVPLHKNPGSYRGLGGAVRGVGKDRFDGYVKLVNNLDLRVHFPSLRLPGEVVPGLVFYLDAGAYDESSRELRLPPLYLSTGAGLVLNVFGYDLVLYAHYFFNEEAFTVSFDLGAHFN